MSFTERTPHERGFARIHEQRVRPALDALAAHHRKLLAQRRRRMRVFGGLALVAAGICAAAVMGAFSQVSGLWAPLLIIGAWIVLLVSFPLLLVTWGRPAIGLDDAARRRLMPIVAEQLGLSYAREAPNPPEAAPFHRRGLITRANLGRFEDALTLHTGGAEVTMLRADFANRGNKTAADWNGLLLQAELPAPAPATIRIGGDDAWRRADGFAPVTVTPAAAPDVAADAPQAAAEWLPEAFLERLGDLRRRFEPEDTGTWRAGPRRELRVVIEGSCLRLSIRDPAKPPFPMPDPTADPTRIESVLHALIADAALPLDIAAAFGQKTR